MALFDFAIGYGFLIAFNWIHLRKDVTEQAALRIGLHLYISVAQQTTAAAAVATIVVCAN